MDRPENNPNFLVHHYWNSPVPIISEEKYDHAVDYGSDQLDYEDHSMTMLHQRPSHWRSFWVVVVTVAAFSYLHFVILEVPFTGTFFGSTTIDVNDNIVKYGNDDEHYHDWNSLK